MNRTPSAELLGRIKRLFIEVYEESEAWKCCLNCQHFHEETETCTIASPPSRPPARVITFACSAYKEFPENESDPA